MCGICGELRRDGAPASAGAVAAMTDALERRGPDGTGIVMHGPIGFGHRRLKIIDLSDSAEQPMVDSALGLTIAFNGCIYNYPELRSELEALGYRFFSHGDTEVILKAWHAWGRDAVSRFNGMFAFVLYERDTGRVVMARDRFGIKPLYIAEKDRVIRFASSLPALLKAGGIDTSIDRIAFNLYMTFHAVVPPPRTILNGVRKLPPATLRFIEADGTQHDELYWNPPFDRHPDESALTSEEWRDRVLVALKQAVARRMVADVPVGVLLSGGVDSSVIVGLLAEAGQKDLMTFSVGFEEANGEKGDEFKYSDLIAERFATRHHQIFVPSSKLMEALPETIAAMSEPMVSYDNVGFYLLSKEVSRYIKVVQSGQGADEVFGGYHWYPPLNGSNDAVGDYARVFFDRSHEKLKAQAGEGWCADRDEARAFVAEHFARPGAGSPVDKALRLEFNRHAGRRPGEARRQHDDGMGAGGTRAFPRPRTGGTGRAHTARGKAQGERQGHPQGRRPAGRPGRGDRPEERLLPGAAAQVHFRAIPRSGARRADVAAGARARAVPEGLSRTALRGAVGAHHAAAGFRTLAGRSSGVVAAAEPHMIRRRRDRR